jgi:hypothetical protein
VTCINWAPAVTWRQAKDDTAPPNNLPASISPVPGLHSASQLRPISHPPRHGWVHPSIHPSPVCSAQNPWSPIRLILQSALPPPSPTSRGPFQQSPSIGLGHLAPVDDIQTVKQTSRLFEPKPLTGESKQRIALATPNRSTNSVAQRQRASTSLTHRPTTQGPESNTSEPPNPTQPNPTWWCCLPPSAFNRC